MSAYTECGRSSSTWRCSTTWYAGTALTKLGVVDFATTIAPGLRDVLLTGKAVEATRRRSGGRQQYDAVIMDAPPTGRIGKFLNVAPRCPGWPR